MNATDHDQNLVAAIYANGGARYICGTDDRSNYERLVELGWLTSASFNFENNLADVFYQITAEGMKAVATI